MKKQSAGILLYRLKNRVLEVLLVHPGGPFWAKKDMGSWSIPKGEFIEGEEALSAAKREFLEETGIEIIENLLALSPIKQKSGKIVYAWALEKDVDADKIKSNTFELEWPPKSGQVKEFPEIDKGEWFDVPTAKQKFNEHQVAFLDELIAKLGLDESLLGANPDKTKPKSNNDGPVQLDLF